MADRLEENKPKFREYLVKNKWTRADTTPGKITDNNANGVKINFCYVMIGHFDQCGWETNPYIFCNADKFEIKE